MAKFIFVTGGVTSSLGKGIISASLAKLLQARGLKATIQKFDPYINVDPGTLNPYEHGECYVTDDGAETDLDLGHYERFLNISTSQANNVTTGRIYQTVINKERQGAYLGKTVQIIPHITDEIKRRIQLLESTGEYDVIITELGGTVGDIESLPYLEAVRQMKRELRNKDCMVIHLTLIPYLNAAGEHKTKPTQHSVKELQMAGIIPDVLVCRAEKPIAEEIKDKLALFCNVDKSHVIEAIDASTIYEVPLLMQDEKLDQIVIDRLELEPRTTLNLERWKEFLNRHQNPKEEVNIVLVGKYNELPDAYKSIHEAFVHAGAENECKVNVIPIHSENLEDSCLPLEIHNIHGLLVAPGFGDRGIEGKIQAVRYVRERQIPFFGICLGMQCAVVEHFRNVVGYPDAASTEVNQYGSHPVICLMADQEQVTDKGGTMRLGKYECELKDNTLAQEIYGKILIDERHRHRYEFNNDYLQTMEDHGMIASGINPGKKLVEVVERPDHPFFIGVQFHPELKSRVELPHPIFVAFVHAAITYKKAKSVVNAI
ncbi:MAG: CTP synthase [Bacteroidota bacterium]